MPWTSADAERHIKGLGSSKKSAWAKIANSSLKNCLAGGKGTKFCEGYSIRVANSKVKQVGESYKHIDIEIPDNVLEKLKHKGINVETPIKEIDISKLPSSSFAYRYKGKNYFPYLDKKGDINISLLRESLKEAVQTPILGARAIMKLKTAAEIVKIGEYAEGWKGGEGYFESQVQITNFKEYFNDKPNRKPNEDKREIVIPALVEGWGNPKDNNYYTAKAVTEASHYLMGRNKMFLNHPQEDNEERDIKDWAATIRETWTDKVKEKAVTWVRATVHNDWLWNMSKSAPDEIATSLLGRGKARRGSVDGREGNIIESLERVRSCDFVDYAGNVPHGMMFFQ